MTSFIAQIKQQLPPESLAQVVTALRQDANLWASLQQPEFSERALHLAASQSAGGKATAWSPAHLGLISLEQEGLFDVLRAQPPQAVPEKLRYRAASTLEALVAEGPRDAHPDLVSATLLALALRERYRLEGDWNAISEDLIFAENGYWKLPLAILFGLLPEVGGLLAYLLDASQPDKLHTLALHALLSNPFSLEELKDLLTAATEGFDLGHRLGILRALGAQRPELGRQLAEEALAALPQQDAATNTNDLSQIERLLLQSEIHQLSGAHQDAVVELTAAWDAAQRLQAGLASKLAESAALSDDEVTAVAALEQAAQLTPNDGRASAQLLARKLAKGQLSVKDLNPSESKHPGALIAAARVAFKADDIAEAQVMAQSAWVALRHSEANGNEAQRTIFDLIPLLIDLQLSGEAKEAAEYALELSPNNAQAALWLSRAALGRGENEEATQAALLAQALQPKDVEVRRQVALTLQAGGDYAGALDEWQALAADESAVDSADWLSLAECALHTGDYGSSIQAAQRSIAGDSENGAAYAKLGAALLTQGDASSAIQHLQRAVDLKPTLLEAWLHIAAHQRTKGQAQQALNTLEAAGKHCAPTAQLYFDMAACYQDLAQPEQALSLLRQATELAAPQDGGEFTRTLAVALGRLERQLGLTSQARNTLERAYQAAPADGEVAYLFGQTLQDLGEHRQALAALAIADQAQPGNIDVQMAIAQAHLALDDQAQQAEIVLGKVIKQAPERLEAQALLADAYAQQGAHDKAIEQYQLALASELNKDEGWRTRLILGKAAAQLDSGNNQAALSTLEAMQKQTPGNLEVLHALCDAYRQLDRAEEAFQIAHKVYLNAGQDAPTVLWYAEQAQAAGKLDEAKEALVKAVAVEPGSSQLTLALGKLQWAMGEKDAAGKAFKRLLLAEAEVESRSLAEVADFLVANQADQESIPYWTRALQLADRPDGKLYDCLSKAYVTIGKPEQALRTLDESLQQTPGEARVLAKKADLLVSMDRPQAALQSLDDALEALPNDPALLFSKARLLYTGHDYSTALEYAERAVAQSNQDTERRIFAAELAMASLQPERALTLIGNQDNSLELTCLKAEILLDKGEEVQAAKALAPALEINESHPRVLALLSRLAARKGDQSQAEQALNAAVEGTEKLVQDFFNSTLIGVALAAQRLQAWEQAALLLDAAIERQNHLPRSQFALAAVRVQQAEWQQLCQAADVPVKAMPQGALKAILAALEAAQRGADQAAAQQMLAGWKTRAELRLAGQAELAPGYPASAPEAAALFAARIPEAEKLAKAFLGVPDVLIERALIVAESEPHLAYDYAKLATKSSPKQALYQAIAAKLSQATGETLTALDHIEQATALWPTQARWQAFAAELNQALGEDVQAIARWQEAAILEPNHAAHHLALGKAHMSAKSFTTAIEALEQAHKLDKKQPDTLLALAQAYRGSGNVRQAQHFALRAAKAAPHDVTPLMVQAELALEAEDAAQAKGFIDNALKLAPQHPFALRLLAEVLDRMGRTEEAIAALEQAQKIAEDPIPYLIRRAQLFIKTRGEEIARQTLERLSERYPERAEVFYALSQMLAVAGEFKDAIQAAQHALKQADGRMSREDLANLQLHLGQLLKHRGQLDQSLHHLDEAAKQAPYLAEAHLERGRVFLARRQHNAALEAFELAAKAAPLQAEPHFEAALALKEAKDYSRAERELRQAAKLAPKDLQIQRQLAGVIALNLVHKQPLPTGVAV